MEFKWGSSSRMKSICSVIVATCFFMLILPRVVMAQDGVESEYHKTIQYRSEIRGFSEDMFGDDIDLATGTLEIVQTDVDLAGNSSLPVRMGRRFVPGRGRDGYGHFKDWDMDIPYLNGTFYRDPYNTGGWAYLGASDENVYKRCSNFETPLMVIYLGGAFDAKEYWHGNFFYLPGTGRQEILRRNTASTQFPAGGLSYPLMTKDGSVIRCLPTLSATSEANSQGEGFEITTPDGTVYTFDHMVSRPARSLKKNSPEPFLASRNVMQDSNENAQSRLPDYYTLPREEVFIFPTRVRDRFGNTITYSWSSSNPWRLLQILASDGRHLDITYPQGDSNSYQVSSVSDGSRVWNYSDGMVTQPDGSVWNFGQSALVFAIPFPTGIDCDRIRNPGTSTHVGTITSPTGATVEYTLAPTVFGRSWMFRSCRSDIGGWETPEEPYLYVGMAVTKKKITGPGLPAGGLIWTYSYGSPNHCWNPASTAGSPSTAVRCDSSSPTTRLVTVVGPDGSVSRHTFGNRYGVDEGLLLKQELGWNGTSALRTVSIDYGDPRAAPYAINNGYSIRHSGDFDVATLRRPQRRVVVTQQGRQFTWEVASDCAGIPYCFDTLARPTKVVRGSTP